MIAALKSRRCIGSDKEAEYIAIAKERIRAFENGVLPIRPIGRKIYVPRANEKVAKVPEEWTNQEPSVETPLLP